MMKKIVWISLLFSLFLVGCQKNDNEKDKTEVKSHTSEKKSFRQYDDYLTKTEKYVKKDNYKQAILTVDLMKELSENKKPKNSKKKIQNLSEEVKILEKAYHLIKGNKLTEAQTLVKDSNISNSKFSFVADKAKVFLAKKNVNNVEKEKQTIDSNPDETQQTDKQKEKTSEQLSGYSDDQVEYARVWLTVIGNQMLGNKNEAAKLHVTKVSAGTPIDGYDAGSVTYPTDVIMLSGPVMASGSVVYSSNHNGTITLYPVPSHWQILEPDRSNPDYIKKITQDIIDKAKIVSVGLGNPDEVKALIEVEEIN